MSLRGVEKILAALGDNFLSIGARSFVYGSQGRFLRRNIESLWFDSCVTTPPYNVFPTSTDGISDTARNLVDSSSDGRPFGIAIVEDSKSIWNLHLCPDDRKILSHRIARVAVIVDENNGKDTYHRQQRERKVWWRKFARHPSRFTLMESKKINKNRETIDITARFDFGDILLETIVYQRDVKKIYPQIAEEKDETPAPHIVEHIASLDWGCLAMLCDGFEPSESAGELNIHPKLSPYKVGFCLERSADEDDLASQEKSRLILYLRNLLKSKGLETVLTRNRRGIETLRVPLIVTVDDLSLQNGIVGVTSRLTTITEAVHFTELPKYIAARCA